MGKRSLRIRTFGDAVSAAFGLHDRFGHAHAAVLLDDRGRVRDLTAFTLLTHTEDHALSWAYYLVQHDARVTRLVLLSALRRDVRVLREEDIAKLRLARRGFEDHGVDVCDWIQFDGEWTRSLAFSIGLGTWGPDGKYRTSREPSHRPPR